MGGRIEAKRVLLIGGYAVFRQALVACIPQLTLCSFVLLSQPLVATCPSRLSRASSSVPILTAI